MRPIRSLSLLFLTTAAACATDHSRELSVMTYNVRYGTADDGPDAWQLRRELAFGVVRTRAPDVVGMQECLDFQRAEFLTACPGYASVGVAREADGSGEASPILYRSDRFELLASGTFWLSETPDVPGSIGWDAALPRICTWALLEEHGGGRLWVFNTHFDHQGALARLQSARSIAARIAAREPKHPAILLGDLNAGEGSEPLVALLQQESLGTLGARGLLVDTFRAVHPAATSVGTFHGFRGTTDGAKIDHILATPDVEPLAAEIVHDERDGRFPSDHFPVVARVRVGGLR